MERPEYEFVTKKSTHVKMEQFPKLKEYRAFKVMKYDYVDMKLGSVLPDPLRKYIIENLQKGAGA